MSALLRDPVRRRYRHNWERAIHNLELSAQGPDTGPALLEAARARYALFRWSANEADRESALGLSSRAARKGMRPAAVLATAIRAEAGDDRKEPRRKKNPSPKVVTGTSPLPEAKVEASVVERESDGADDSPADPALAAALVDLSSAPPDQGAGNSTDEGKAQISKVRTWSSGVYTRAAIYLSHWVQFEEHRLPAAPGVPARLAIDFRPAELQRAPADESSGKEPERVHAVKSGPDTVRVVLDLDSSERVHLFSLEDPPRLIVDMGTEPIPSVPVAVAPPSAVPAHPPLPPSPLAETGVGPIRRVVVDAGHGGFDPGAIGPGRVREKDVTLAIARRLARRLREDGFLVVETRPKDRFLSLEERTAIANTSGGDLFVSVHANAHPRRNREGIETYFLNVADNRYAARLAARENGVELPGTDDQANRILTDLDAKVSAASSRRLALLVQREVTSGVRVKVGAVRDLGVKSALFYVLLGARMPAVLVETGFISNREEERRLASAAYEEEVAAGIARAVLGYARTEARVASR